MLEPASVKRNINKPISTIWVLMYNTLSTRPFHTPFLQTRAIIDVNNIKTAPTIRITIPTNNMIENTAIILIKKPFSCFYKGITLSFRNDVRI